MKLKLKDIFAFINAEHTIKIKYQIVDEEETCAYQDTIYTGLFGKPGIKIEEYLLERKIHAFYPCKDELIVILEDNKLEEKQ